MISFKGRILTIDGLDHELGYPISKAVQVDDLVLVLYDPDAYLSKSGQFPNLVAFELDGTIRWTAELPSTTSGDRYYRFSIGQTLEAASIFSEVCELELATGRIIRREFVK